MCISDLVIHLMERSYWSIPNGTYRVILRIIVKAGCHPVAIAEVVEH